MKSRSQAARSPQLNITGTALARACATNPPALAAEPPRPAERPIHSVPTRAPGISVQSRISFQFDRAAGRLVGQLQAGAAFRFRRGDQRNQRAFLQAAPRIVQAGDGTIPRQHEFDLRAWPDQAQVFQAHAVADMRIQIDAGDAVAFGIVGFEAGVAEGGRRARRQQSRSFERAVGDLLGGCRGQRADLCDIGEVQRLQDRGVAAFVFRAGAELPGRNLLEPVRIEKLYRPIGGDRQRRELELARLYLPDRERRFRPSGSSSMPSPGPVGMGSIPFSSSTNGCATISSI